MLKQVVIEQKVDVDKKSTKIANLKSVIAIRDNDLNARNMVIEKQKLQINKQQEGIFKLKKQVKDLKKVNFNSKERGSGVGSRIGTFEMTSYIAMCREGCTGTTATGINVKNTTTYQGHRIIATDTDVIPLWSIVRIHTKKGSFTAISLDTGGGIDGHEIDFLTSTEKEALQIGRQNVQIDMVRKGK